MDVARVRYVMRAILKMMRLWIGSQCNFFRQSVLLKVGLRRTSLASFVLYALQGMDQRGRCTIEKGIAVI